MSTLKAVATGSTEAAEVTIIESVGCLKPSSEVSTDLAWDVGTAVTTWTTVARAMLGTASATMVTAGTAGGGAGAFVFLPTARFAVGAGFGAAITAAATATAKEVGTGTPDQLYIKVNNDKIWPSFAYAAIEGRDTVQIGYQCRLDATKSISLWEYDTVSSDDNFGELPIGPQTTSQIALVGNADEGSAYSIQLSAYSGKICLVKPGTLVALPFKVKSPTSGLTNTSTNSGTAAGGSLSA